MSGLTIILASTAMAIGLFVIRTRGTAAAVQEPIRIEVQSDEGPITRSR